MSVVDHDASLYESGDDFFDEDRSNSYDSLLWAADGEDEEGPNAGEQWWRDNSSSFESRWSSAASSSSGFVVDDSAGAAHANGDSTHQVAASAKQREFAKLWLEFGMRESELMMHYNEPRHRIQQLRKECRDVGLALSAVGLLRARCRRAMS